MYSSNKQKQGFKRIIIVGSVLSFHFIFFFFYFFCKYFKDGVTNFHLMTASFYKKIKIRKIKREDKQTKVWDHMKGLKGRCVNEYMTEDIQKKSLLKIYFQFQMISLFYPL